MTTARAKKTVAEIINSFDAVVRELDIPDPLPFNDDISLECPTGEQLIAINDAFARDDAVTLRQAIFGDNFETVNNLFLKAPYKAWQEWAKVYMKHFFGDDDPKD